MKKNAIAVACTLMLCCSLSCSRLHRSNINLTVSESEQYFTIVADYNKSQVRAVDDYLDKHLDKGGSMSFANTRIDGGLVLDNGMKFDIEKCPGHLKIKFNKEENTPASYNTIKNFAEGLKPVIQTQ